MYLVRACVGGGGRRVGGGGEWVWPILVSSCIIVTIITKLQAAGSTIHSCEF